MNVADEQPRIPADEYAERRARAAEKATELGFRGLIVWARGGARGDHFGGAPHLTTHYAAEVGSAITRAMMEQIGPGHTDGDLAAAGLSLGARIPGVAQWDIPLASG